MLDLNSLLKMSFCVALVLMMPGPTNTMLLSAGLRAGIRQTWPLVLAEAAGYVVAIALWGFLLCSVAADKPWLYIGIKLLSSVFVFYLGVRMWRKAASRLEHRDVRLIGIRQLFVAALLNPKALLFASTLFPIAVFRSARDFGWAIGAFLLVLLPIAVAWSSLGGLLAANRAWAPRTGALLRGAAVLLLMFSASMLYSVLDR